MANRSSEFHCREHLVHRVEQFAQNVDCEVDGAIERWSEEWWECSVCGDRYTASEVEELIAHDQNPA